MADDTNRLRPTPKRETSVEWKQLEPGKIERVATYEYGQLVNPLRQARKAMKRDLSAGEVKPISGRMFKRFRKFLKRGST